MSSARIQMNGMKHFAILHPEEACAQKSSGHVAIKLASSALRLPALSLTRSISKECAGWASKVRQSDVKKVMAKPCS